MSGKIASFMFTLALIAWQVFDIIKGKAGVLTWILLGIFSLGGLFELAEICESKNKAVTAGEQPADTAAETDTTAAKPAAA